MAETASIMVSSASIAITGLLIMCFAEIFAGFLLVATTLFKISLSVIMPIIFFSSATTTALSTGSHTFEVKSKDATGNEDLTPASHTFVVDTTAPTGTNSINNGAAYTATTSVTLTLTCANTNGCSQMQFSNDGTTYSTPETYTTSKSWTLSSGDGTKTVYAKFKDNAGNWMATAANDTIILDTIPDPVVITRPDYYNVYVKDIEIPLSLLGKKPTVWGRLTIIGEVSFVGLSPISKVDFFINNQLKKTDVSVPYQWEWFPSLSENLGDNIITVKSTDAAGNVAEESIVVWVMASSL